MQSEYGPSSIYQPEASGKEAIGLPVQFDAREKSRSDRVPIAGDFLRGRKRIGQIDAARSDRRGRQTAHGRRRRRRARHDAGERARPWKTVEVLMARQDSSWVLSAR